MVLGWDMSARNLGVAAEEGEALALTHPFGLKWKSLPAFPMLPS